MLFSSFVFLSIFLPLTLALYYASPRRARNGLLLAASIVFYAWGDLRFLGMMAAVIALSYVGGLVCAPARRRSPGTGFAVMAFFVAADLAGLVCFKYFDFICANLPSVFGFDTVLRNVVLPLGISFYTFQGVSYLVDVARGDVPPERNPLRFALFISFFPQLIAGPILKYHEVAPQLAFRRESLASFLSGARRFVCGLTKKVVIANTLASFADPVFAAPANGYGTGVAWAASVAYTLQLYYDFGGYSDMAIGLGRMFGFRFAENFDYPYLSRSFTEFWRRWHISLSTWMKEYLYIPLGGSRVALSRNLVNLMVVFAVSGLWHGAAWTFVVWGLVHGTFVVFEKLTGWGAGGRTTLSRLVHHVYLLAAVNAAWVVFRSEDLAYAGSFLLNMLGMLPLDPESPFVAEFDPMFFIVGAVAAALSTGCARFFAEDEDLGPLASLMRDAVIMGLLGLSFVFLAGSTYNPFIYFRF